MLFLSTVMSRFSRFFMVPSKMPFNSIPALSQLLLPKFYEILFSVYFVLLMFLSHELRSCFFDGCCLDTQAFHVRQESLSNERNHLQNLINLDDCFLFVVFLFLVFIIHTSISLVLSLK